MEYPDYKPIKEVQIATRSDGAKITAIASCRLGLVVRVSSIPSQKVLLDSLLNHTPPDSLTWDDENWGKVENLS